MIKDTGLDAELEKDIRSKINPQYADRLGTESYERKRLIGEIDRLRSALRNHDADRIMATQNTGHLVNSEPNFELFAEIVRIAEREECAKLCDKLDNDADHLHPNDCSEAIRKRHNAKLTGRGPQNYENE